MFPVIWAHGGNFGRNSISNVCILQTPLSYNCNKLLTFLVAFGRATSNPPPPGEFVYLARAVFRSALRSPCPRWRSQTDDYYGGGEEPGRKLSGNPPLRRLWSDSISIILLYEMFVGHVS